MRHARPLVILVFLCGASLWGSPALAQQFYVYPTRGQSPQQESFDKADCFNWAVQQTGFNPSNPPPMGMAPPPPPGMQGGGGFMGGGMLGGAAGGAAMGAVGGAIGGDAAKGAAIGAAAGAVFGLFRRAREEQEMQQQQQQYQAQQQQYQAQQQAVASQAHSNWDRAYKACLTGRGYTVM